MFFCTKNSVFSNFFFFLNEKSSDVSWQERAGISRLKPGRGGDWLWLSAAVDAAPIGGVRAGRPAGQEEFRGKARRPIGFFQENDQSAPRQTEPAQSGESAQIQQQVQAEEGRRGRWWAVEWKQFRFRLESNPVDGFFLSFLPSLFVKTFKKKFCFFIFPLVFSIVAREMEFYPRPMSYSVSHLVDVCFFVLCFIPLCFQFHPWSISQLYSSRSTFIPCIKVSVKFRTDVFIVESQGEVRMLYINQSINRLIDRSNRRLQINQSTNPSINQSIHNFLLISIDDINQVINQSTYHSHDQSGQSLGGVLR